METEGGYETDSIARETEGMASHPKRGKERLDLRGCKSTEETEGASELAQRGAKETEGQRFDFA